MVPQLEKILTMYKLPCSRTTGRGESRLQNQRGLDYCAHENFEPRPLLALSIAQ